MRTGTLLTVYLVLLFFLHQDFWLRDNPALVLGFLPATLAYHIVFTFLAAGGWFAVVKFAWPDHLDTESDGDDASAGGRRQ